MRIDDIRDYFIVHLSGYIAALSTVAVPLVAVPSSAIWTREYKDPPGPVSLFIDDDDETAEDLTLSTRVIMLPVTVYLFVMSATEALLRAQSEAYAQAILDCAATDENYFRMTTRNYFDGVEGKPGIKAAKLELEYRYEENL